MKQQWLKAEAELKLNATAATRERVLRIVQDSVHTPGGIGQLSGMHAQLGSAPNTAPIRCGTAAEGQQLTLGGCQPGKLIDEVIFASYGLPEGSCATSFAANPACAAPNATSIVSELCVGKSSCKIGATVSQFGGTDPCLGTKKHLSVMIHCAGDAIPRTGVSNSSILGVWHCEEQMEKLRVHQTFEIKDGEIHRPPAIGADRCILPVRVPATKGCELTVGACARGDNRDNSTAFSVVNGQIKHVASGLCVTLVNDTQGSPVELNSCNRSTGWAVNTVVNQPTFASKSDKSLCLDLGSSSAGPVAPVRARQLSLHHGFSRVAGRCTRVSTVK